MNMKTTYFTLFLVVSFSGMSYSQNNVATVKATDLTRNTLVQQLSAEGNNTTQLADTVSIEEMNQSQVQYFEVKNHRKNSTAERTIEQINIDIFNVKAKIDAVNSDKKARNEAIASGWFDWANARLIELEIEKKQLENK
jgi:hypothetical protein